MSRKRDEKGVAKSSGKKLGTREPSISSVLHDKHLLESSNQEQFKTSLTHHTIRGTKKGT